VLLLLTALSVREPQSQTGRNRRKNLRLLTAERSIPNSETTSKNRPIASDFIPSFSLYPSIMSTAHVQTASSPGVIPVTSEEELLEKMLQDAKRLSSKMKVSGAMTTPNGDVNSIEDEEDDNGVDTMSPLLDEAENLLRDLQRQSAASPANRSVDTVSLILRRLDSPSNTNLKPIGSTRRASPRVSLGKISGVGEGSVAVVSTDSPLGNLSKTSAPSSVYLLHHHNSGADDFSSVGSASLRASSENSKYLTDALVHASLEMADAVKEIQSANGSDVPGTPTPSSPDEEDGNSEDDDDNDQVSVKDYTSRASTSSNSRKLKAMAAKLEAGIPDFTAHAPNAKWEKVSSAQRGDEDYVMVQDFSKTQSTTSGVNDNTKAKSSFTGKTTSTATTRMLEPQLPVAKTRLQIYRAQARRQRRRQRFMAFTAMALFLVWYLLPRGGGGDSGDSSPVLAVARNDTTAPSLESNQDTKTLSLEAELEGDEESLMVVDAQATGVLDDSLCWQDENDAFLQDDIIAENVVDEDLERAENSTAISSHQAVQNDAANEAPSELVSTRSSTSTVSSHGSHPDQKGGASSILSMSVILTEKEQRACKNNLFHRIFRKRCRIFARELKLAKKSGIRMMVEQQHSRLKYH
jgi:hypothetical protein